MAHYFKLDIFEDASSVYDVVYETDPWKDAKMMMDNITSEVSTADVWSSYLPPVPPPRVDDYDTKSHVKADYLGEAQHLRELLKAGQHLCAIQNDTIAMLCARLDRMQESFLFLWQDMWQPMVPNTQYIIIENKVRASLEKYGQDEDDIEADTQKRQTTVNTRTEPDDTRLNKIKADVHSGENKRPSETADPETTPLPSDNYFTELRNSIVLQEFTKAFSDCLHDCYVDHSSFDTVQPSSEEEDNEALSGEPRSGSSHSEKIDEYWQEINIFAKSLSADKRDIYIFRAFRGLAKRHELENEEYFEILRQLENRVGKDLHTVLPFICLNCSEPYEVCYEVCTNCGDDNLFDSRKCVCNHLKICKIGSCCDSDSDDDYYPSSESD
jgi:hypothetical protein